jgi:hypothetical protein
VLKSARTSRLETRVKKNEGKSKEEANAAMTSLVLKDVCILHLKTQSSNVAQCFCNPAPITLQS